MAHNDRPATLRDVATAAGVHPATASRALNPGTRLLVSEETARRVSEAADRLGYRPNPVARSLRTRRSHTIGVLIPDLNNPLFPPMIRGIEDRLAEHGYVALIGNTDVDLAKERLVFEQMRARHVDGFVLATAIAGSPILAEAAEDEVPVVLMNRTSQDYPFSSVSVDNEQGVRAAVAHLVSLGHTRIGHIAGPQNVSTGAARLRGFQAGMAAHKLQVTDGQVVYASAYSLEEGVRCGVELLGARRDLTAVVAGNDMLAVGCYGAFDELDAALPGRRLGDRVQRHAVHRPAQAAAVLGAVPALPARHRGGHPADRADRGQGQPGEDPLPRARARRPWLDRAAGQRTGGRQRGPAAPPRPRPGLIGEYR